VTVDSEIIQTIRTQNDRGATMKTYSLGAGSCHVQRLSLLAAVLSVALIPQARAETIYVSNPSELQAAVAQANAFGGNTTILLRDGTYTLADTLYVNSPNIPLAGASGDRAKAIVQGDAMGSSAKVGNLIRVAASNFRLSDITLQKSKWHLIQIAGETNADSPTIRNCVLRDAYEQMLKVSIDAANPNVTSDNGLVENCVFEYTAGVAPQYYVGGIDAHGAKNWVVRGNTFRNIISPSGSVAEFAIHFWDGSADSTVERNTILNCDRGIGFGMDGQGNARGIIRNNMIYHAASAGAFADVAIAITESPGTQVYNNSIIQEHTFPWAIEYRWVSTSNVLIENNLTNKPIISRDGGTGVVAKNVTNASRSWFVDAAAGDLHLVTSSAGVVDAGLLIQGLADDFDGQPRPSGSGIDIGADEILAASPIAPPTNLWFKD
jgi:hypothetical protein